jgi:hypothetical protein
VGDHFNILRDRAVETQKYQGLVGLDAAKPASPAVSEVYIATDTNKVYVCVVAGQWSLLGGATSHADVQREGETDDHAQYYNDARLTAWHMPGQDSTLQEGQPRSQWWRRLAGWQPRQAPCQPGRSAMSAGDGIDYGWGLLHGQWWVRSGCPLGPSSC